MLLQAGANIEAENKVSSSSSLCQLSDGYKLAVVVVVIVVVVGYDDKRYSSAMNDNSSTIITSVVLTDNGISFEGASG